MNIHWQNILNVWCVYEKCFVDCWCGSSFILFFVALPLLLFTHPTVSYIYAVYSISTSFDISDTMNTIHTEFLSSTHWVLDWKTSIVPSETQIDAMCIERGSERKWEGKSEMATFSFHSKYNIKVQIDADMNECANP